MISQENHTVTLYLAGPINNCTDSECKDWREYVKSAFKDLPHVKFLDPMVRDYRGREDNCVDEIVEGDKQDIDASDILIVSYDKPSVGTSMEILYAWEREKPVFIAAAPGVRISPWMAYHSTAIFSSLDNLIAFIKK